MNSEKGNKKYVPVYKLVSAKGNLYKKQQKTKRIGVKTKRYISKTHHERNQTDNDDS